MPCVISAKMGREGRGAAAQAQQGRPAKGSAELAARLVLPHPLHQLETLARLLRLFYLQLCRLSVSQGICLCCLC